MDTSKNQIISEARRLKNYAQAAKNASIKQATQSETTYTYTGYDTEGREVQLTKEQYEALTSQQDTANKTYSVIPAEVVNSGANWWINSEGQYEWVPVTEADKQHLAEINAQRARGGYAARTTLILGAAKTDEYSEKWYSTGGGNRGVGEEYVRVIQKPVTQPVQQQTKEYSYFKGSFPNLINPVTEEEKQIVAENGGTTNLFENNSSNAGVSIPLVSSETNEKINTAIDTGKSYLEKANEKLTPITTKLPEFEKIEKILDSKASKQTFSSMIGFNDKIISSLGNIAETGIEKIQKHESKVDPITSTAKNIISFEKDASKALIEGSKESIEEDYEGIRTNPASKAIEYGAYYAGGAVFGAASKGIKALSRTGGIIVDVGLGASLAVGSSISIASGYQEEGGKGAVKSIIDLEKEFVIGGKGFKKGDKLTENVFKNIDKNFGTSLIMKSDYITETNVERQFEVLKGLESTKIKNMGEIREYIKIKTDIIPESQLPKYDIKAFENTDKSGVRELDVSFTKTISETPNKGQTQTKQTTGLTTARIEKIINVDASQTSIEGEPVVLSSGHKYKTSFSDINSRGSTPKKIEGFQAEAFDIGSEVITGYGYQALKNPEYISNTLVEHVRARPIFEITPTELKIDKNIQSLLSFPEKQTPIQKLVLDESGLLGRSLGSSGIRQPSQLELVRPMEKITEINRRQNIILEEAKPKIETKTVEIRKQKEFSNTIENISLRVLPNVSNKQDIVNHTGQIPKIPTMSAIIPATTTQSIVTPITLPIQKNIQKLRNVPIVQEKLREESFFISRPTTRSKTSISLPTFAVQKSKNSNLNKLFGYREKEHYVKDARKFLFGGKRK